LSLPFLTEIVAADMAEVDGVLRASLDSDVALVRRIAEYIVAGGGKRLRPIVLLLAAGAQGYRGRDHHTLAAVIEMIHTATLLHDDVVDESSQRRGRATANAAFGNAAAVLVGDFLYSRAFQLMVGTGRMRVLAILADATNEIAQGEVLQLMSVGDASVDENAYLGVIRRKTAKLFEAAARIGAVLGDATASQEDAFARYGTHLGLAFQIQDDVLDYQGDAAKLGKNLGDDLAEGKVTLPLIRALAVAPVERTAFIRAAIDGSATVDFARVHALLESTDAIAYARERALAESKAAEACLAGLPSSPQARTLLQLAAFAANRDF
jgi:octaprenyl-diphosphate synthase